MMAKRIIINIILALGVLPVINPFLVYFNALIFGYNFSINNFVWNGPSGFFQLFWGGTLFYYSIFILVFVLGIYNICIILKVRNTKKPFNLATKFVICFILFSLLAWIYDSDFYRLGGSHILLQKIIVLIVLSAVVVILHYFLIDKQYEIKEAKQTIDKIERV